MATKFASEAFAITMPDGKGFTFWFDGNGKITLGGGNFENPKPNAFSLVQVKDCPFATPLCISVCYVHRLEQAEGEIHKKYVENSRALREVLANIDYKREAELRFAAWICSHCPYGFRWNVSGDIISREHADFIKNVCVIAGHVPFWLYTRSFAYVEPLLEAKNLVINLSADKDNYEEALATHDRFGLRICYLTVDGELPKQLPRGSVIFPSHNLRGRDLPVPTKAPWWQFLTPQQKQMVCPPDFFGQSENMRCGTCKKCLAHPKESFQN